MSILSFNLWRGVASALICQQKLPLRGTNIAKSRKQRDTDHGVLQLWVSVREMAPSLWNILSTARLVPIECPDSTLIKLAILFSA